MASAEGLYNVLVTNGYIEKDPFRLLLQTIQAMNIDLKSFDDELYKKRCSGDLQTVKTNIKTAVEEGVHVEITTLIIPGENDSEELIEEEAKWLSSLNPNIPLHLSRYFPAFKFNKPETQEETLKKLFEKAKKHLNFVYIGNFPEPKFESTYCPNCSNLLIERKGYTTVILGLGERGECSRCHYDPGIRL